MYQQYNPNPKGKNVEDCTVRAMSKALNQDWDSTYWGLSIEGALLKNMPSSKEVWDSYLRRHGFDKALAPDNMSVDEFMKTHPRGTYLLALSNHVVCLQDGEIFDTWDSTNETVIFYWKRG